MNIPLLCYESIDRARERQERSRIFHRRLTALLLLVLAVGILLLLLQVDAAGGWDSLWR